MRRRALVAAAFFVSSAVGAACGSTTGEPGENEETPGQDAAGTHDAGKADAASVDGPSSGGADAARIDAALSEAASTEDAGTHDAGAGADAAEIADAGVDAVTIGPEAGIDAAVVDAAADQAAAPDASAHDAAAAPDAAVDAAVHDAAAGVDVEDAAVLVDAHPDVEDATVEDATVVDAGIDAHDATVVESGADATIVDAAPDVALVDASTTPDAEPEAGSCAAGASFTGGLTNYAQTAANACGQPWPDAWSVDTNFPAVAMNTSLFDEGSAVSACNKCVSVTGTTGATATFVVVDECPAFSNTMWCQTNHLDIDSLASYNLVENGQPGSIDNSPGSPIAAPYPGPVTWKFVPCPWTSGIVYLFEPNGLSAGTYFYLALNVYHTKYGLQSVSYRAAGATAWTAMQARTDDMAGNVNANFVINGVAVPNPIDLQVVDEHGQVIEDDGLTWSAPTSTFQSTKQFATCN